MCYLRQDLFGQHMAECHRSIWRNDIGQSCMKTTPINKYVVITDYNHDTITDHNVSSISDLTLFYLLVQTGPMKPARE